MRAWLRGLRAMFRRDRVSAEIDAEIQQFISDAAAEHERRGLTPEDARRAALVEMGGALATRDRVRASGWERVFVDTARDLRFAVRSLRRHPGFSALAIALFAIGIGATTALFSVADEVLLRPLPVRAPEELVLFGWKTGRPFPPITIQTGALVDPITGESTSTGFSYLTLQRFQEEHETISGVVAFSGAFPIGDDGDSADSAQLVSGNYFTMLGVPPEVGRVLVTDDDRNGAPLVAVISHRFWDRRYGRDPQVIGRTIAVGDLQPVIVGVTAAGFAGTQDLGSAPDVSLPIQAAAMLSGAGPKNVTRMLSEYWIWGLRLMARTRAGATPERVLSELQPVFLTSARDGWAGTKRAAGEAVNARPELTVSPGAHGVSVSRREMTRTVGILAAVTGVLLLIVCANVATLLYARSEARQREAAIRLSLGAGRGTLIRQLVVESVVVAIAGGAAGLALAVWSKDLLLAWLSVVNPRFVLEPRLDLRVLAFTLAASTAAGVLVAFAPAWRASSARPHAAIKDSRPLAGRRPILGRGLIVGQIALALLLTVTAGLFARTLTNLRTADLGVDVDHLLSFGLRGRGVSKSVADRAAHQAKLQAALDQIGRIAAVTSVAFSDVSLLNGDRAMPFLSVPGLARGGDEDRTVFYEAVSPNFFATAGMRMVAGRALTKDDAGRNVAVVNETLARRFFGGRAVGERVGVSKDTTAPELDAGSWLEVVGIVADARYMNVREAPLPALFQAASAPASGQFLVRTAGDPTAVIGQLRAAVDASGADLRLTNVRSQADQAATTYGREQHFARVSLLFGAVALLLTAIGVYGVLAYSVARQTHDIGVRLALGATPGHVMRRAIRETLLLAAGGIVVGVVMVAMTTRALGDLLYGVTPQSAGVIAIAVVTMIAVALAAAIGPVRRASRIDPLVALRE